MACLRIARASELAEVNLGDGVNEGLCVRLARVQEDLFCVARLNDVPALPSINSFAHAIGRLGHKKVTLRPDVGMVVKGWRLLADEDEKSPGE